MREYARDEQHDELRDHGEDERVPDRLSEERVVDQVREVREAGALAREGARGGVREAEVDREDERAADEQSDEEDRGRDQEGGEKAAALRDVSKTPPPGRPCSDRRHRGTVDGLRYALQQR